MHACGRPVEWDSWAAPVALTRNAGSAETLETVGPDAPTNVDGWTAHDIAAHVVSLDRFAGVPTYLGRILVARGVRLNDLARRASQLTQRAIDAEKRRGLGETIARLRQPSPPLLLRAPVRAVGLFEVWAHEDVRRANAIERDDHPALDEVIASLRRYSRIDAVPEGRGNEGCRSAGVDGHGGPTLEATGRGGCAGVELLRRSHVHVLAASYRSRGRVRATCGVRRRRRHEQCFPLAPPAQR